MVGDGHMPFLAHITVAATHITVAATEETPMLGLGIAASYSPPVLRGTEEWPKIHQWLVGNAPLPNELEEETAECGAAAREGHRGRVR